MRSLNPVVLLALVSMTSLGSAQSTPQSGEEVLQRMHDAYAGKWYRTLTFVQKTTRHRPDGTTDISTWFESLEHAGPGATRLRIDIGDPSVGNGILYTADSTSRLTAGKLRSAQSGGNEFLPMIEGVYMQPVSQTLAELKDTGIDMTKVMKGEWQNRPVWIVGASSPSDTTSPQFWIDIERNVVVRMIIIPAPNAGSMDIHLDGYVPLERGWLATKVAMSANGKPVQTEEYSEWKANVDLPKSMFDPATWTTSPHWAKGHPAIKP
jgi:hypothetical protein